MAKRKDFPFFSTEQINFSDRALDLADLPAIGAAKIIVGAVTTGYPTAVDMSGDTTISNAGVVTIGADKVTTAKILNANVTVDKLAANAVTTAKILDSNVTGAKLTTASRSKSIVKEGVTIATAAGATNEYIIAPEAGSLSSIEINPLVALAKSDTNYITWTVVNLGQAGTDTTAMLAVSDANTTKVAGTALAVNTKRALTVHGTAANLVVAQGDKIKIVATVSGTLANTVTVPVYISRFSVTA